MKAVDRKERNYYNDTDIGRMREPLLSQGKICRERRGGMEHPIKAAVIDGQGGGVGRALAERIRAEFPGIHIRALGTDAQAASAMIKAGADDGATGENASSTMRDGRRSS